MLCPVCLFELRRKPISVWTVGLYAACVGSSEWAVGVVSKADGTYGFPTVNVFEQ